MYQRKLAALAALSVLITVFLAGWAVGQSTTKPKFEDVDTVPWAWGAINWAVEQGIIVGKSDIHFAPNDSLTRAEMVVILCRALDPSTCPPRTTKDPEASTDDTAPSSSTSTLAPIDEEALGYGFSCLIEPGCNPNYFDVPTNQALRVGVDIAPGKWRSRFPSINGDCTMVALTESVTEHSDFPGLNVEWSGWERDLLLIPQPDGSLQRHPSVREWVFNDWVYADRRATLNVLGTDYAVIIDSAVYC